MVKNIPLTPGFFFSVELNNESSQAQRWYSSLQLLLQSAMERPFGGAKITRWPKFVAKVTHKKYRIYGGFFEECFLRGCCNIV